MGEGLTFGTGKRWSMPIWSFTEKHHVRGVGRAEGMLAHAGK